MNAVSDIISLMNYNDNKAFVSFLKSKNTRNDTKNTKLFKLLETDDINSLKNLYSDAKNNDAYHALRKRLYDNLVEFMANRTFEANTGDAHEVLRLLVVSRFFLEHKLTKTAFKCLAKAEGKAAALEYFSLLNEIYHTQIQYAHLNLDVNLSAVIEKFTVNRASMQREEQLNIGYALLRRELAEIQYKGKVIDLKSFIFSTMESLGVSLDEALTYKSLYQMLFIANEYASINFNFNLIEPFFVKSYDFIKAKNNQGEGQLYYHIYILYFMSNFHFRTLRFDVSETYLEKMLEQMQKQNNRYYSRFSLRYFLLAALNKNFLGNPGMAIELAEKALKGAPSKADPVDVNDLRICLIMFMVQQNDRTALKYMGQFAHTDSWYEKKLGMLWAIRKSLLEILLYTDVEHTELALSRLKSFKRRYKKYLTEVKEDRVMEYALLVERYILKPEIATQPAFAQAIHAMLVPGEPQDIFVISFLGWLLAKADKRKSTYEVTLELVSESNKQ